MLLLIQLQQNFCKLFLLHCKQQRKIYRKLSSSNLLLLTGIDDCRHSILVIKFFFLPRIFPVTGATTIKKFSSRFIGPFSITHVVNNVSYRLQLPATMKIHPSFHVSLLKPYHNPSLVHHSCIPTPLDPLVIHGEKEYFVEAILDTRLHHNQRQYLVKWLHYPSYDNTWEPEGNLSHCKEKIAEFRHSLTSQTKRKKSRKALSKFSINSCSQCISAF